jgi:hypothetical protein
VKDSGAEHYIPISHLSKADCNPLRFAPSAFVFLRLESTSASILNYRGTAEGPSFSRALESAVARRLSDANELPQSNESCQTIDSLKRKRSLK